METTRKPFYGRDRVIYEIVQGVLAPQPQSFSVVGPKFIGKTHLLQHLAAEDGPLLDEAYADLRPPMHRDGSRVLVTWIDCDWRNAQEDLIGWLYTSVQQHVRERAKIPVNWARIEANPSPSYRLWQLAQDLSGRDLRLVLLLDNFDRVFENQLVHPETVDELRPLTLEMALLVATEQPLHDLDRELAASPLFNVMTQLFLGLLDTEATRAWMATYAAAAPVVSALEDDLVELTGMHPFLLRKLGDILSEVRQLFPAGDAMPPAAQLPLLRLRLAEHGRLLFETTWKRVQRLSTRVRPESVDYLLRRLLVGTVPLTDIPLEHAAALNWLINQAIVVCCVQPKQNGYQFFTPLFGEFMARRMQPVAETKPVAPPAIDNGLAAADLDQFTKTEAALLRYFQAHQGETVSVDQLLADVWRRPDATNRRVQEAIRRLRLQLEESDPPLGMIENDRGRGYRYIPAG